MSAEPVALRPRYTIGVLAFIYMISFIDRQVPALLLPSIRADLDLSDTQASLLVGLAFALVYTTAAIPLARIADRTSRRSVIVVGVAIWGVATALCGFAASFWQFFLARLGVGFGEAALTPNAYALIYELRPSPRRGRAMSLFVVGGSIGYGLALLIGAGALEAIGGLSGTLPAIGDLAPWRLVLIALGFITVLSILPLLRISEPRRPVGPVAPLSFRAITAMLWRDRVALMPLFVAVPLTNLASYGYAAWGPTYFQRIHGWSVGQAGATLGAMEVMCGFSAALFFGWLVDRLVTMKRRPTVMLDVILMSVAIAAASVSMLWFATSPALALIALAGMSMATASVAVIAPLALHAVTPNGVRGQVSALFLLVANLVGIGFGPTAVALVTDNVFRNELAVGRSIALVCATMLMAALVVMLWSRRAYGSLLNMRNATPTAE